jgi:uncharacterized protein (TIGR03086 family)
MGVMTASSLPHRHARALDLFTDRVRAVAPTQWGDPTPCADWTVRDLVNHLTVEQLWVPRLVTERGTVAEVGDAYDGDVLGDDPPAAWERAARGSREAFAAPGALEGTVHLSYGDSPSAAYCDEMTTDLVVHAWDLARAVGAPETLPTELVAGALRQIAPHADALAGTGYFAAPLPVPAHASDQARLLCLLGRRP